MAHQTNVCALNEVKRGALCVSQSVVIMVTYEDDIGEIQ